MKRLAIVTGILALAAPVALAQYSTWTSDPAHSEVDFTIRHGGVSNVHGRIGGVAATLVYNEADVTKSTVTATIDISTVDTGVAPRDSDLKSDSFFDVANFPTATFTSTNVARNGNNKLTVAGNFTVHGDHKLHSGFSATTTISRAAYGIGTKFPAALVGDEVKLTIELEIIKQEVKP